MRLVSQNGNVDIPYNKAILLHAQDYVMARVGDKEYLMGEYSSMKKSYRVMEIMQKQFLDYCCNYHSQSGVFYFPKDTEVEV